MTRSRSLGDPVACMSRYLMQRMRMRMDSNVSRNDHGHCGRDYREQVLCDVKLVKP